MTLHAGWGTCPAWTRGRGDMGVHHSWRPHQLPVMNDVHPCPRPRMGALKLLIWFSVKWLQNLKRFLQYSPGWPSCGHHKRKLYLVDSLQVWRWRLGALPWFRLVEGHVPSLNHGRVFLTISRSPASSHDCCTGVQPSQVFWVSYNTPSKVYSNELDMYIDY